jgi:pimeloyl-ACP methyl ester carboxylesterase
MPQVEFETGLRGRKLAFLQDGSGLAMASTGFFFLTGWKSDMLGTKAAALAEVATASRRSLLRFDYSGHGQSGGALLDFTISDWLEDATHMYLTKAPGRRVIVGSSMGGWLALLLARKLLREDASAFRRIAGLVLICPATDMTRSLMWDTFTEAQKDELERTGVLPTASGHGEITAKLIADGQRHQMLHETFAVPFPVRIIQGTKDADVPVAHAERTMTMLSGDDITLTLIKGGDHRLSRLPQIRVITETAVALAEQADGLG